MGMPIEDALKVIRWEQPIRSNSMYEITKKDAFNTAIEVMRKYQNIVQIMERTVDDGTSMYDTLQEIEEVIEDGKID